MQKVPGRAPAVLAALLAALAMILPAPARAVTLAISSSPRCLSVSSPDPCNGNPAWSEADHVLDFDLSAVTLGADEIITGATLRLILSDDFGAGDGTEKINLVVDGVSVLYNADAGHDALITLSDLSALEGDTLSGLLTASRGDFFFGGATLTIDTAPGPANLLDISLPTIGDQRNDGPVPAPAPLLLLGLSVTAMIWLRRARP